MNPRHPVVLVIFGAVLGAIVTSLLFLALDDADGERPRGDTREPEAAASEEADDTPVPPEAPEFSRDISGNCTLKGRVAAADGTPIKDAVIRLKLDDVPWAAAPPPHHTATDETGSFRIPDLNGDLPFTVWAFKPGFAVSAARDAACDEEIVLTLEPGGALALALPEDIPDGSFYLQLAGSPLWPPRTAWIPADTSPVISGLEPGEYAVSIRSGKSGWFSETPLNVVAGERTEVEVALAPSKSARIRVTESPAGTPISDAAIIVHPTTQPLLKEVVSTDSTGLAVFKGQTGTRYLAEVSHPGMEDAKSAPFVAGASVDIELTAGLTVTGQVRTKQGEPIAGATLEVVQEVGSGLVPLQATPGQAFHRGLIDAAGDGWPRLVPLSDGSEYTPGPLKIALPEAADGSDAGSKTPSPWRATDAQGRFVLDGLPTGRVTISGQHDDFIMAKPAVLTLERDAPIPEAAVYMKPGQTVLLRVVEDDDGFPIPDAEVFVYDFDKQPIAQGMTVTDGYIELRGLPRSVRIEAEKAGFVSAFIVHHGKTGAQTEAVMTLHKADRELTGRVKDERGFGAGGVAVVARSLGRGLLQVLTGVTESDGSFTLPGAGAGRYHVTADGAEKGRAQVLDADYKHEIRMVLDPSPTEGGGSGPAIIYPQGNSPTSFDETSSLGAGPDNLGVTGKEASGGEPLVSNETPIHTQFGEVDELAVTGPPPGRGGIPISLSGASGKVTVTRVTPGSRVDEAGLTRGSRLLTINGEKITGVQQARRALQGPIGSVVMIEVAQGDELFTVVVQRERVASQ